MSVQIKVPALGESVSEATVAKWYKKPGDEVSVDELLLELETEKVTLEVNASAEGVLESIDQAEGTTVTVGQVVGTIKAGAVSGKKESAAPVQAVTPTQTQATPITTTAPKKVDVTTTMPPSVQKLVTENNLNPLTIPATGKDGRINKEDVLAVISNQGGAPSSITNGAKPVERVRMSRLRKTIAQRLKDSQNTAAILSTFNEIDMSKVIELRAKYKDKFQEKHAVKLGFMSFFVKAVVNALKEVPSVNAEIEGDDIVYKHYYDIGVAVGTEQGLVVPVVRDADKLSFSGIEKEIMSLAVKAKDGKLSMSELTGGTFSITNGGVYGSLLSTPIINPPQTGIIGLHNTQERPVAINGKVEIRPMMYIALSYDHRVIDGKDAVTFLVKVKQAIEDPERLLLDL
ncbi:MAG: 2-oxoglutarate dehydrogenase complex dihydrolipoyllysine-residue succinyltransferase [Rickettsiales bacterium]|nr:2-oxoglutarate dehydrogenase complex dihydrolipoyllysine-residue succinyltransferase [Rickettsiales bacterium]MCA0253997.1 2-oxoglutarate dehydrogenase complex dihydrolipoyllysine-residue succinyltransferase [Pseudomonadota bacterium]